MFLIYFIHSVSVSRGLNMATEALMHCFQIHKEDYGILKYHRVQLFKQFGWTWCNYFTKDHHCPLITCFFCHIMLMLIVTNGYYYTQMSNPVKIRYGEILSIYAEKSGHCSSEGLEFASEETRVRKEHEISSKKRETMAKNSLMLEGLWRKNSKRHRKRFYLNKLWYSTQNIGYNKLFLVQNMGIKNVYDLHALDS